MKITMDDSRITTIPQLKAFLKGSQKWDLSLRAAPITDKYALIAGTAKRFGYWSLRKKDKHQVLAYLKKLTGFSQTQLLRLLPKAQQGRLTVTPYSRIQPHRLYTSRDIKLLEKTDSLHLRLSERATREILRREFEVFHHQEYQTISRVSHSHIGNLRHSNIYRSSWINHTKARQVPIGITQPPENYGRPGSIRVDTVHQPDVYHINSIDELTQWEVVFCVPEICERCMEPALENLIDQYPFVIFNFHSDRGGETINHLVARLLQKLAVKQTKSRARHPHDNALVESKNASVVRKNMGWTHVHQDLADLVNNYYSSYFNPYLNFHRPCGYPTIRVDEKGKKKSTYQVYQTPYEALKSIPGARQFLKPGISFEKLDIIAYRYSDNQFAEILRKEERKLFQIINQRNHPGS